MLVSRPYAPLFAAAADALAIDAKPSVFVSVHAAVVPESKLSLNRTVVAERGVVGGVGVGGGGGGVVVGVGVAPTEVGVGLAAVVPVTVKTLLADVAPALARNVCEPADNWAESVTLVVNAPLHRLFTAGMPAVEPSSVNDNAVDAGKPVPLTVTVDPAAVLDGVTESVAVAAAASCAGSTVVKTRASAYPIPIKRRAGRVNARREHVMCCVVLSRHAEPDAGFEGVATRPETRRNEIRVAGPNE
ncbi:MAG: hypothetical protein NVSMB2_21610 [Chloroflexota bacterium]